MPGLVQAGPQFIPCCLVIHRHGDDLRLAVAAAAHHLLDLVQIIVHRAGGLLKELVAVVVDQPVDVQIGVPGQLRRDVVVQGTLVPGLLDVLGVKALDPLIAIPGNVVSHLVYHRPKDLIMAPGSQGVILIDAQLVGQRGPLLQHFPALGNLTLLFVGSTIGWFPGWQTSTSRLGSSRKFLISGGK